MPLPGTPHVARMAVQFTFGTDGNQCENVFYIQDPTDQIFVDPTATCNAVDAAAIAQLKPALAAYIGLTGVSFEDVRTFPFGGISIGHAPVVGTGPSGGSPIPSSVSLAIKKSSFELGRSARGRWFWPVGASGNIGPSNDQVNATAIGTWVPALQAFQSAVELALGGVFMGFVSYRTGGAQRTAGHFLHITGWSVTDNTVDNQRRRLTGRGR